MAEEVTAFIDSAGVLHKTLREAQEAESKLQKTKEEKDIERILIVASRRLGRQGLPTTLSSMATIAKEAYPDLFEYYGVPE